MKAISIKQPWANLISFGQKTIETKTWTTSYRGNILIVSSKRPNIFPAGYALAIVKLVDCRKMTEEDEVNARCDYQSNLYAWVLSDIKRIKPFPVEGKLGIYEVNYKEE